MAGNSIVFTDNLDEVLGAFGSAKLRGLAKIGAAAQGYAKDNTPVRTGTLRDSIGVEVREDEDAVYIGTMVDKFPEDPYGIYVELGAQGRPGVHMVQGAATEHGGEYKNIMEKEMKNA